MDTDAISRVTGMYVSDLFLMFLLYVHVLVCCIRLLPFVLRYSFLVLVYFWAYHISRICCWSSLLRLISTFWLLYTYSLLVLGHINHIYTSKFYELLCCLPAVLLLFVSMKKSRVFKCKSPIPMIKELVNNTETSIKIHFNIHCPWFSSHFSVQITAIYAALPLEASSARGSSVSAGCPSRTGMMSQHGIDRWGFHRGIHHNSPIDCLKFTMIYDNNYSYS